MLLIIAYLSLGAFFQLLVRNLATGMSLTAIICNPAFGFAGVGFPLIAMGAFPRLWGDALPLRWFMQILFDQAVRGLPPSSSVEPLLALGGSGRRIFFAQLAASSRAREGCRRARRRGGRPSTIAASSRGVGAAMFAEMRRVLNDRGVFGLIVMAPVIYGLLYPQPYLGQILRRIPIAVVDQDHTELSRNLVQAVNADEATEVAVRAATLAEAQAALARREVFAILGIPRDTENEVLKGDSARLPAYVDSAYFLLYNRMLEGILEGSRRGQPRCRLERRAPRRQSGSRRLDQKFADRAASREPLFNPTGGYASYVVPAAFILILQQTLLLGIATLGGVTSETGRRHEREGVRAILGQAIAHLCLALPGARALSDRHPADCRLFDLGQRARPARDGDTLRAVGELSRPVRKPVVPAARNRGAAVHRDEPAALLHRRRVLAGRGHPGFHPRGQPRLPEHLGDRWPGPHQPDGREPARRRERLGVPLDPGCSLRRADNHCRPCVSQSGRSAMDTKPGPRRARWVAVVAIAAVAFAAYRAWTASASSAPILGVVHETEIRIAPETSGRLVAVKVKPGDQVRKGEVLAVLSSPELAASLLEAKASADSARADRANVIAGVRKEVVDSAAQDVSIGEANLVLAQKQYARSATLAAQSIASKQQLDESTTALDKAQASLDLAPGHLCRGCSRPDGGRARHRRGQSRGRRGDRRRSRRRSSPRPRLIAPTDGVVRLRRRGNRRGHLSRAGDHDHRART